MDKNLKEKYDQAIEFWDRAQASEKADYAEVDKAEDWKSIGSEELFNLICERTAAWAEEADASKGSSTQVLDYGCGSGWLDVILAKKGIRGIKSVDVAPQAVNTARLYASAFDAADVIDHEAVSVDWLTKEAPENTYHHAVCINVLDVVPMEVAESIVENLARVCKKGASVIIALNPYFTPELIESRQMDYRAPYIYVNDILRVNNHTDAEWSALISKYFDIVSLEYFKWDVEQTAGRRFYTLSVK